MSEQEKEEEEKLLISFSDLNLNLKKGNHTEFFKSLVQLIENDNSFRSIISKYIKKSKKGSTSLLDQKNKNQFEYINNASNKQAFYDAISQNLSIFDEKLKLLVIGDESAGKTHFIANFIKFLNGEKFTSIHHHHS